MKRVLLISALLLFVASNGWAEDQNGFITKNKFGEGIAQIDILQQTTSNNKALAIGINNRQLAWGWCDNKDTIKAARSCALEKCQTNISRIFVVNDESYNDVFRDIVKELGWSPNQKQYKDDYDRYIEEYNKSKQSTHWSDGLAEGAVKGLVQGLFLILIVSGIFKFAKKRKNSKKKQSD